MEERAHGTAGEAIHAVSRLLTAALNSHGPAAVHAALAREARTFFRASWALLIALDHDERRATLVAGDPPADAGDRVLAIDDIGPLRAVAELRAPVVRAGGEEARELAGALGVDTAGVMLLLPMRTRDSVDHVLVLVADGDRAFGEEDVEVAGAFANAAAASLAQLRLADEQAARIAQQSALARAAKTLNDNLDLAQLLSRICSEAAAILEADAAAIYCGNPDEGLTAQAVHNLPPETIGYHLTTGTGLAGKVLQLDRPMLTNDYQRIARLPAGSPFHGIHSSMAVPMHWAGELRGVLSVGYHRPGLASGERLRLLETFAELAAVACSNASMHAGLAHAARTDSLTGCLNHAALQDGLRREIERCERLGHELSLVLLDLDDFKQVNESHGHLVGDEALRRVGHALRSVTRPYDLVARYGGDEFAIVAVDAGEALAAEIADRAIERVSAALGDLGGHRARRASAGVAEWAPRQTPTALIDDADRALLFGKQSERRGVVIPVSGVPESFRPGRFRRPLAPAAAGPSVPEPAAAAWPAAARAQTERLRKRTRQLALANALGTRLAAMTDVNGILEAAVDELHRAFGYFLCAIVRDRDDGYVETVAMRGRPFLAPGAQWSQPRTAGLIGRCLRERRAVLVGDVTQEADYRATPETASVRSELAAPIWVGEKLWGVVNVEEVRTHAFDEDDARLVQTLADQIGSALRSAILYEQLERAYLGTAEALAAALEAKDSYTAHHGRSIVAHAEAVGRRLGLSEPELRDLRYGAIFHDIGKIAVPEAILNKRGPLTPDERAVVEQHTVVGEQILAPIEFLANVRPLVRHEHERWDGTGYPDGLGGAEIPLGARIILACDAWHAMTSDRPYRAAMPEEEARAELRRHAGSQFDPRVVDVLLDVLDGATAESALPVPQRPPA